MSIRIQNTGFDHHRTDASKGVRGNGVEGSDRQATQPTTPAQRSDQVQISDAGRALAAQIEGKRAPGGELSADRISEIRQRVLSGAYNSTEVVNEVARRLLASGDI